jgi:ferric iron reductase protein FhuF
MSEALAADTPFTGALAGFADILCWSEESSDEADTGGDLWPHLLCYQASVGGPWRAACSLWGQVYFNALLIPATCLLARGWRRDAFARALRPCFCPKSGVALRFTAHGESRRAPSAELTLVQLLETHIERVINQLAKAGGLSKPMLWEGAELTLRWTTAEIAAHQPTCASRLRQVAERAHSGSRFALAWSGRRGAAGRRLCCLRYQLDGCSTCPEICPRRKGRVDRRDDTPFD